MRERSRRPNGRLGHAASQTRKDQCRHVSHVGPWWPMHFVKVCRRAAILKNRTTKMRQNWAPVNIQAGTLAQFSADQRRSVAQYRSNVHGGSMGLGCEIPEGIASDRFDRTDTAYVVATDFLGRVAGISRLQPTARPYLLAEVISYLIEGGKVPSSPDIWELSCFSAINPTRATSEIRKVFYTPVARSLLFGILSIAIFRGARKLITVVPVELEALLANIMSQCNALARPP
jgi:acyl homoserine lactone synthase